MGFGGWVVTGKGEEVVGQRVVQPTGVVQSVLHGLGWCARQDGRVWRCLQRRRCERVLPLTLASCPASLPVPRLQARTFVGDGVLDEEKLAALHTMAQEAGLPQDVGDGVIATLQTQSLVTTLQAAHRSGTLTLGRLEQLRASGVDISKLLSSEMRMALYRTEIGRRLSDGTGVFNAHHLLEEVPINLALDPDRAARTARTLADEQKRTTLVQARLGLCWD